MSILNMFNTFKNILLATSSLRKREIQKKASIEKRAREEEMGEDGTTFNLKTYNSYFKMIRIIRIVIRLLGLLGLLGFIRVIQVVRLIRIIRVIRVIGFLDY